METKYVNPKQVIIPKHHRAIKPIALEQLKQSIKDHGYNVAYPIVLDSDILVDGQHRIQASIDLGIESIPFVPKPDSVSSIKFSLQCNADGQLCSPDDVFDLAELCYGLSEEGWAGEKIAGELGWSDSNVTFHKRIKEALHPRSWDLARSQFTNNLLIVNDDEDNIVNHKFTNVNWRESHFRALLKHLPCIDGDRVAMRAQLAIIKDTINRAGEGDKRFGATRKTVTANWIEQTAQRYAWHIELAKYLNTNLVSKVGIRDRIALLKSVRNNVYGKEPSEDNRNKFDIAVKILNEKALGVILYYDDTLSRLPLLEDKSIALVIADPPYNVTKHEWDYIGTDNEYLEFTKSWLDALRPKLASDYHLFIFCDPDYQARIEQLLLEANFPLQSRIIWSNRSLPSGRNASIAFVRTWQMVFHCGTHDLNWSPQWSDERFDVQVHSAPNANTKDGGYHPTPKPLALIELFVRIGSKPTDTVLDPFAGGGTTGEACINVKQRQCILIEKQEDYCAVIEERLKIRREE